MELSLAISGARAALDMAKLALNARDDQKLKAALADMQERLYDAMSATLDEVTRSQQLQAALVLAQRGQQEAERKLEDRAMYSLCEIRPGAFAYASHPNLEGHNALLHHLCQPCYDKGVKSILRYTEGPDWGSGHWTCPAHTGHRIEDTQRSRP